VEGRFDVRATAVISSSPQEMADVALRLSASMGDADFINLAGELPLPASAHVQLPYACIVRS